MSQLSLEQEDQKKKRSYCLDKAVWGEKKRRESRQNHLIQDSQAAEVWQR